MTDERRHTYWDCPDAEVCKRCPCAGDDDVCFPGERLRAELSSLQTALEEIAAKGDVVVDHPEGGKAIVCAVSREAEECAAIARAALDRGSASGENTLNDESPAEAEPSHRPGIATGDA